MTKGKGKRKRSDTTTDESSSRKAVPGFHAPSELVTFIIGKKEEPFKVHKEFVVHHSCVLAAAFSNTQFIEGKTQTYRLDDVRPNCFRLFVQWIYTQDFDLYTPKRRDLEAKPPKYDVFTSIITQDVDFAELWVLGDKFMIPGLQNKAIDKLLANSSLNVYNPAWFRYAYENTNDSSTLRKWAVDYSIVYIGNSRTGYVQTYREFYPKEMLLELLEKAAKPYPRGKRELTLVASDYYVETDV